jgi:hypothetical protein
MIVVVFPNVFISEVQHQIFFLILLFYLATHWNVLLLIYNMRNVVTLLNYLMTTYCASCKTTCASADGADYVGKNEVLP